MPEASLTKKLLLDGEEVTVRILEQSGAHIRFELDGEIHDYHLRRQQGGEVLLEAGHAQLRGYLGEVEKEGLRRIWIGGEEHSVAAPSRRRAGQELAGGKPVAPLSGLVCSIAVAVGDRVEKGAPLAVMEAMKMQMVIPAPYAGSVSAVLVSPGQQVTEGTELVRLEAVKDDG